MPFQNPLLAPPTASVNIAAGSSVGIAGTATVAGAVTAIPNEFPFPAQYVSDVPTAQTFLCYPPAGSGNVSSVLVGNATTKAISVNITGITTGIDYSGGTVYIAAKKFVQLPFSAVLEPGGLTATVYVQQSANNSANLGPLWIVGRADTSEVVATNAVGTAGPTNFLGAIVDGRTAAATAPLLTGGGSTVIRLWSIQVSAWANANTAETAGLRVPGGASYCVVPVAGTNIGGNNNGGITFPGGLPIILGADTLAVYANTGLYAWAGMSYSLDAP